MAGFTDPWLLAFLLLIPIFIYVYYRIINKKKKEAIKFSNLEFVKSVLGNKQKSRRNDLLFYLTVIAVSLMIIGFANPHIPLNQSKEGVNVILVIDDSGSMQATDYKPTRLDAAKNAGAILLESLQPKDNSGIIVFEAGATTAAYLSPFKEKVIQKLKDIAPKQGQTAVGDGLALGVDMATSIPNQKSVIILISDGQNNAGVITPDEATQFAKNNKIQVYTVGIGTVGKTVVGYDWFGNPAYDNGLDEDTLKSIASSTGATYFRAVDSDTLNKIYGNIGKDIKREKEETNIKDYLFFAALLILLLEIYLRYGGKRIIQ